MNERSPFTHILVPTDGSENSIHAGRLAIQMASIHNTQMTLVYVVDSAIVDEIASATSKSVGVINRELESKGQRYLDYLARRQEAERTSSAHRPEQMDDQELLRLAQKLKEKDYKSAHER
jgi:nucleotide-binding universal stress UspA family protein